MDPIWLLEGDHEQPGWKTLEADSKADAIDLMHFDRDRWALVRAPEAPTQYDGLIPTTPQDGMYVNPMGVPLYIVNGEEVFDPMVVIEALGEEAKAALEKIGDPVTVIDRLGRAY